MTAEQLATIGALVAGGAVSTLLLRSAWQSRSASRAWLIVGAWAVIAVALAAGAPLLGTARSIFIAMTLISVAALAIVATGIQFRPARAALDKASIARFCQSRAALRPA